MTILDEIIKEASKKGMSQASLAIVAGMHPSSLSRAVSNGNCRMSTLEGLARAAGVRMVCVEDNDLAELLIKGEVF